MNKIFQVAKCLYEYEIEENECKKVVINAGKKDGIKLNDKFIIYSLGDVIHDPSTGEEIESLEIIKGKGKVIHVQERISTLESIKVKKADTKRVVYETPNYGNSVFASFLRATQKEEIVKMGEDEILPFENVKEGDYAKFID